MVKLCPILIQQLILGRLGQSLTILWWGVRHFSSFDTNNLILRCWSFKRKWLGENVFTFQRNQKNQLKLRYIMTFSFHFLFLVWKFRVSRINCTKRFGLIQMTARKSCISWYSPRHFYQTTYQSLLPLMLKLATRSAVFHTSSFHTAYPVAKHEVPSTASSSL